MRTISVFARSGSCGRSTIAFAIANTWVNLGCRVGLIDLTDDGQQNKSDSTVRRWANGLFQAGVRRSQLSIARASKIENLDDLLASMIMRGVERVVIDTAAQTNDLIDHALARSQLILCPTTGPAQASKTAEHLDRIEAQLRGVTEVIGIKWCMDGQEFATERKRLDSEFRRPFLQTELDRCDLIGSLLEHDHFHRLLQNLIQEPVDNEGALMVQRANRAGVARGWQQLLALVAEVEAALVGLRLTPPPSGT